jgi:hypothetical protein
MPQHGSTFQHEAHVVLVQVAVLARPHVGELVQKVAVRRVDLDSPLYAWKRRSGRQCQGPRIALELFHVQRGWVGVVR